jgi:hypothetical protein
MVGDKVINLFEDEMYPLLEKNSTDLNTQIEKLDEQIDIKVKEFNVPLNNIKESLINENSNGDKKYDETSISIVNALYIVLGIVIAIAILLVIMLVNYISKPINRGVAFAKKSC